MSQSKRINTLRYVRAFLVVRVIGYVGLVDPYIHSLLPVLFVAFANDFSSSSTRSQPESSLGLLCCRYLIFQIYIKYIYIIYSLSV